ncbi:hypothetical protein DSO57_1012325 [Entomophthora muscae]|uniref:Uncharacterized protein n=1 Tax=Entomophthora muscae TaxID=34485 RepID=A0ACC2U557_9FUNG|nr:hypothetical protein DSO57_1012325 [Entomophthora muscae]
MVSFPTNLLPNPHQHSCHSIAFGPPHLSSDSAMDPDAHIKSLANPIINIQTTAYTSAYKAKRLELSPKNSECSPLPKFNVGDHVLYYQHRVGGHAHKLDTL